MSNPIKKFGMWLFNKNTKREIVHSLTEEDLLKQKGINEALKKENSNLKKAINTRDSQLAKVSAEKFVKKEKINKQELNNKVAKELKDQEKDLNIEKYGKWFSWTKFERKMYKNEKFRKNFLMTDKDGESSYKYGELLFSTKGLMGISDNSGKIKVISPDLKGLIHKPESLFNQYKLGRLQLAIDKDGDYLDGIDDQGDINDFETEIPSLNEETGEYEKTSSLRLNARKYIIELQDKLREKDDKVKTLELSINGLRSENSELKRGFDTLLHAGRIGQSRTSESNNLVISYSMEFAEINKKIATLQSNVVLKEKEISVKDAIIDKLLSEIEQTGDQTAYKRAKNIFQEAVEFVKVNTIPVIEKEKVPQKVNNTNPPG